jgi:prepilin-type N-terminal cleavage/methylation domain-containing protein
MPRGFSMIEMAIATAIFAVIIVLSYSVTSWTTQSFAEQVREATLTDKGEKALRTMMEDLADATRVKVIDVYSAGYLFSQAQVNFRVPIRFKHPVTNPKGYSVNIGLVQVQYDPVTGEPLNYPTFGDDFDFNLKYGWRDNARYVTNLDDNGRLVPLQGPGLRTSGPLPPGITMPGGATPDGYISFRFVMNTRVKMGKYGANGMIHEYREGVDLDKDGMKYSTYALGYIERSYYVGNPGSEVLVPSSRQPLGDSCIVQPIYPQPGDPRNLKSNRIFISESSNPTRVEVCIWMLIMNTEGEQHLVRATTTDFLRNNAQYVTATSATGTN